MDSNKKMKAVKILYPILVIIVGFALSCMLLPIEMNLFIKGVIYSAAILTLGLIGRKVYRKK